MTLIIIAGGIDLSVGAILAMGGLLGTMAMEKRSCRSRSASSSASLTGAFWGFVNGLLTTRLRINPFIVTLGTLGIVRGSDADHLQRPAGSQDPAELFVSRRRQPARRALRALDPAGLCASLMHVMLEHTRLGRYAFAIGSNPDAAFYAGIPVAFHTTAVYAIGGMLTGLAGMIEASRLMTGQPTAGQGYELQAIAAVVIGGGSLRGGEGSVIGTLVGAFIMGLLSNGSDLLGISPYLQQAIIGAVIILAVSFDELRKRKVAT